MCNPNLTYFSFCDFFIFFYQSKNKINLERKKKDFCESRRNFCFLSSMFCFQKKIKKRVA